MIREEYRKARRTGLLHVKQYQSRGEDPYPVVLDEMLEGRRTRGESPLGVSEIPVELIAGIRTRGRQSAFDRQFYPLLEEDTEFASKWIHLLQIQTEEGFRDPIKVYEYRNRFYVLEGNKRVSISKVMGMPSVLADVIRILPEPEDTVESRCYEAFLAFHKKTGIWDLLFTRPGSYEKLCTAVGKAAEEDWTEEEIRDLKSAFTRFSEIYRHISGPQRPEVTGDAFLRALAMVPYGEMTARRPAELSEEMKNLRPELQPETLTSRSVHVMEPETPAHPKGNVVARVLPSARSHPPRGPWKAAFLYDYRIGDSEWVYAHELGRRDLQNNEAMEVETVYYEGLRTPEQADAALEQAVAEGARVVFTTTPKLMPAALKAAVRHPDVYFLNCSLDFPYKTVRTYYARQYEFRFLMGLIAGTLCRGETVGIEADYPIYGTIAGINAFASGVQMVCPEAKVRVHWVSTHVMGEGPNMSEKIVLVRSPMVSREYDHPYGLFLQEDGQRKLLAGGVVNWGRFYEKILRSIQDGTWKKPEKEPVNYWWGFSAEVLELVCAEDLPEGTRRLAEDYTRYLAWGACHPFRGVFTDQNGRRHGSAGEELSPRQIAGMDWLNSNVIGSIPEKETLSEPAREMVALQGVLEETK